MGCASSKRIDVAVDVYRPPPSSFAVFDINAVQEPWLMVDDAEEQHEGKSTTHVPDPIVEELNKLESDGPQSWDEVSKALEVLKPTITDPTPSPPYPAPVSPVPRPAHDNTATDKAAPAPSKSLSFHTLDELDTKLTPKPTELKKNELSPKPTELKKNELSPKPTELKKNERVSSGLKKQDSVKPEPRIESAAPGEPGVIKSVRENIFVLKDRLEREKEGKGPPVKWDPLSDYPEKCPTDGADKVVLYTTSLGGVRRTYEDSNRVRSILEAHRVVFDERDVALHGGFLSELRELVGQGVVVPRLFVKGRYIGGAEEVVGLNEMGRLGRLMSWARVERGVGWGGCGGCGGARFVPCLECGGSCKVVVGDQRERCLECNENGLVHCPACH